MSACGYNLHSLGRDQHGNPSETLQALTCHLAIVVLSYCQQRYEAVICLSLPTKPGQSACGGNLHTPWDAMVGVSLQKYYKPWAVTKRLWFSCVYLGITSATL